MDLLIAKLALSLAIGFLVGLERGWRQRDAPEGSRVAGIRTYAIAGLYGGVLAELSTEFGSPEVFYVGLAVFGAIFAWYDWRDAVRENTYSVTSVIAALAVVSLGALAVSGDYRTAAAGGAALAGMLGSRTLLHGMLRHLSWIELRAALLLAAMTAIVLPLLPNRAIDPWGGVNPFEVWLFTVLTATVSYAGYVAVRLLGPSRGLLMSSLAGAVVSSTAVTVALSRRAAAGGPVRELAGGTSLAAMVSVLRVMVVLGVVKPAMLPGLAAPALAAAAVLGGFGLILMMRTGSGDDWPRQPGNPFDLGPLLIFALSFLLVSAASAYLADLFGARSVLITSGLSGLLDVDVASLSVARLAGGAVSYRLANLAVLIALGANAITHIAIGVGSGVRRYYLPVSLANMAAAAAAAVFFVFNPVA